MSASTERTSATGRFRALADATARLVFTAVAVILLPILEQGEKCMSTQRTPDDIKIIAQFLAGRSGALTRWEDCKRDAFKLRQHLKDRGSFKLVRKVAAADPAKREP